MICTHRAMANEWKKKPNEINKAHTLLPISDCSESVFQVFSSLRFDFSSIAEVFLCQEVAAMIEYYVDALHLGPSHLHFTFYLENFSMIANWFGFYFKSFTHSIFAKAVVCSPAVRHIQFCIFRCVESTFVCRFFSYCFVEWTLYYAFGYAGDMLSKTFLWLTFLLLDQGYFSHCILN